MKYIFYFLLCFGFINSFGQTTENPKIKRKSTPDVFISKIEILENKTVVYMYYQAKSQKESLKEYLKNNPEMAEKLRQMDPFMRQFYLQQIIGGAGATISFQPSSYLKTSDGKKYKFLSASNIPKAPERQDVEIGKRYNFKITFEKLPKGFEVIDLIESKADKNNDFTFWNFYGIKINNPDEKGQSKEEIVKDDEEEFEEVVVTDIQELRLFGKIKDAEDNSTISAKITCQEGKSNFDSLQTSRSGSFEFIIKSDSVVKLVVSAPGYHIHEETMNMKIFKNKESIPKDIFLEKAVDVKPKEEKAMPKAETPKPEPEPIKEPEIIGTPSENKEAKASFKLDKVYFNVGEATLLPASFEQLDKLVVYLKENEALKIQIEGHTDNQGDPKMNKKLSLDRAYNVREYLVNKGINKKRIKFLGLGDTQPINSNNKEEDRKQNRRVEYRFID